MINILGFLKFLVIQQNILLQWVIYIVLLWEVLRCYCPDWVFLWDCWTIVKDCQLGVLIDL